MATQVVYLGDGVTKQFDVTFSFPSQSSVFAYVNAAPVAYTWVNQTRIELASFPAAGAEVLIRRETDIDESVTVFSDEAVLTESDLNESTLQLLNALQEIRDSVEALRSRALQFAPGTSAFPLPADIGGKFLGFDADGHPIALAGVGADGALRADLASSSGAALAGYSQLGTGAISRSVQSELRDIYSVKSYGALGNGASNDAAHINAALVAGAGGHVVAPKGTYLIEQTIMVPDDTTLVLAGWGCILKKNFNGTLLKLGKRSKVIGGCFDANRTNFTGDAVVIDVGDNTPTLANQGQQVVEYCLFVHVTGYPVNYTTANKGWLSSVRFCRFSDYGSDAAIKWPDETAIGGNRSAYGNYSDGPLVNVGGCDNGRINDNDIGGLNTTGQGIVFPAGTANRAKKVIVNNNRFGLLGGTINFRGTDCQWDNNIIAGSIVFESNASNDGALNTGFTADNILVGTLTDNSGADNNIVFNKPVEFTPTWTGGSPALGNADVRCDYVRDHGYIRASYNITMGSTSTYGTGGVDYLFSLPIARYTSLNTDVVGAALVKNVPGAVRTVFASGDKVKLYTAAGAIGTASGLASGDQLIFHVEYRLF